MKLKELPKEDRPREKMMYKGVSTLSNAELLALFVENGTREKTAIDLSEEVLALSDKGIMYLANCSVEEICKVRGIGPAKACKIKAAVELGKRINEAPRKRRYITSAHDVQEMFMERMRHYEKEHFNVLLLNTKGEIIGEQSISVGDINSSIVNPRETFIEAVRRNAVAIILIHNHPSGNPEPSGEDLNVTKRLVEVGNLIGIKVLDHLIIGDGTYVSLKDRGAI